LPVVSLRVLFESSPILVTDCREEDLKTQAEKIFQLLQMEASLNGVLQGLCVWQLTVFYCSSAIKSYSSSAIQARRCWWYCLVPRHWDWWSGLATYYYFAAQSYSL